MGYGIVARTRSRQLNVTASTTLGGESVVLLQMAFTQTMAGLASSARTRLTSVASRNTCVYFYGERHTTQHGLVETSTNHELANGWRIYFFTMAPNPNRSGPRQSDGQKAVPGTTDGTIVCTSTWHTRYNLVQKTDGICTPALTPSTIVCPQYYSTGTLQCSRIYSEFPCCCSTVHFKQSTLPTADPLDYDF